MNCYTALVVEGHSKLVAAKWRLVPIRRQTKRRAFTNLNRGAFGKFPIRVVAVGGGNCRRLPPS